MNDYFEKEDENISEKNLLNNQSKDFLYECAKWGKIMGVVGYFFAGLTGLMVIVMLFLAIKAGAMGVLMALSYSIIAMLYYFPSSYIYKYSDKVKKGIQLNDANLVSDGFKNLKSLFKFWGVLLLIAITLYVLMLIIFLFFGTSVISTLF